MVRLPIWLLSWSVLITNIDFVEKYSLFIIIDGQIQKKKHVPGETIRGYGTEVLIIQINSTPTLMNKSIR